LAPSLMRYQQQYAQEIDYRAIMLQNIVTGGAAGINLALAKLEKQGRLSVGDIARTMQISEERVLELMEMQRSVSVSSLEKVIGDEETESVIKDFLGKDDEGFTHIENKAFVEKAFMHLDDTEQRILRERFWQRLPQSTVAENLGVSQMYISRAERRILKKLRAYMEH